MFHALTELPIVLPSVWCNGESDKQTSTPKAASTPLTQIAQCQNQIVDSVDPPLPLIGNTVRSADC